MCERKLITYNNAIWLSSPILKKNVERIQKNPLVMVAKRFRNSMKKLPSNAILIDLLLKLTASSAL